MSIPFSEALRRARIKKKLSQQQLADAMNVSRSTVTKWETGKAEPRLDKLLMLCSLYDCDLTELVRKGSETDGKAV